MAEQLLGSGPLRPTLTQTLLQAAAPATQSILFPRTTGGQVARGIVQGLGGLGPIVAQNLRNQQLNQGLPKLLKSLQQSPQPQISAAPQTIQPGAIQVENLPGSVPGQAPDPLLVGLPSAINGNQAPVPDPSLVGLPETFLSAPQEPSLAPVSTKPSAGLPRFANFFQFFQGQTPENQKKLLTFLRPRGAGGAGLPSEVFFQKPDRAVFAAPGTIPRDPNTGRQLGPPTPGVQPKTRSQFQTTLDVLSQQAPYNAPDFRQISDPKQKAEILKQARQFQNQADINRTIQEEITRAALKVQLPRQISENKVSELIGRINVVQRMDEALDRFKDSFDIQGTGLSESIRKELVKFEGLTQITRFTPLEVGGALNDKERQAVAAINILGIEMRSLAREGRPSDFDAARILRALTGRFLDSPRTVFNQLLATRDSVTGDLQREIRLLNAGGFKFQFPESDIPNLRRPKESGLPQIPGDIPLRPEEERVE